MALRPRLFAIAVMAAGLLASAPARAAELGQSCKSDDDCPLGSICAQSNVCTALPKKKSVIPFYFHQPGEEGYRHIVPLLYFSGWDKHHDTKVQIPFFARRTDKDNHRALTVIPLLFSSLDKTPEKTEVSIWPFIFGAKYRPAGGRAAVVPLFWWQKRNQHSWLVLPLLLSGGQHDEINDVTEAVFMLAGYYRRHGDDTWRIFAPLLFEHETRDTNTFVGPFLWSHREKNRESGVVFPLYWHALDRDRGTEHTLFIPLFDSESENHGRQHRVIALFGAYDRNDDISMRTVIVWAPPIFHRSDAKRTVDVVPPLFMRWTTHDDYSRGLVLGPFAFSSDSHGSTPTLFPLYWRFHDNATDATTQLLFPIAACTIIAAPPAASSVRSTVGPRRTAPAAGAPASRRS